MLPLLPLHAVQVHVAGQQPHAVHDHAHPEERAQQDQAEGAPARAGRCIPGGDIGLEAGTAASGSGLTRGGASAAGLGIMLVGVGVATVFDAASRQRAMAALPVGRGD